MTHTCADTMMKNLQSNKIYNINIGSVSQFMVWVPDRVLFCGFSYQRPYGLLWSSIRNTDHPHNLCICELRLRCICSTKEVPPIKRKHFLTLSLNINFRCLMPLTSPRQVVALRRKRYQAWSLKLIQFNVCNVSRRAPAQHRLGNPRDTNEFALPTQEFAGALQHTLNR